MGALVIRVTCCALALVVCVAESAGAADGIASIRFNQLGFLPDGPKRAIMKSVAREPLEWRVESASGALEAKGVTRVFGENAASGEPIHIVDFSALQEIGRHFHLIVGEERSRPFAIADDIFDRLRYDAVAYFYHNRSGIPIEAKFTGDTKWARPAGHAPEIVGCFEGEDERGIEWPGCDYQLDATGGWYDAGDHGKYVVNAGITVWTLLSYYERAEQRSSAMLDPFADGKLSIPEQDNGVNDLLDEVRWELQFLLGMQAPQGAKLRMLTDSSAPELVEVDVGGMAHHKVHGKQWTAMPSAPHEDTKRRYAYPPSTTATLNLAANAAQCARIWRKIDAAFAERCLIAAERAYAAAVRNPNLLPLGGFSGGGGYGDRDASDEFYWAAAELFVTTGEDRYAQAMRGSPHFLAAPAADGAGDIAWSQVRTLGTISLAVVPNRLPAAERERARANLIEAAERYLAQSHDEGYAIPYSSTAYKWGSNSDVLNRGIVLGLAFDFTQKKVFRDGVVDALDYVLGRNPLDQSYISGYGVRPMRNPHHRHWAHQKDPKYPPPPPGALSGGPNSTSMSDPIALRLKGTCAPQTCWTDHIDAYALNEVAINWNAPLFWVAAFVAE
jgi:endoglucanase